MISAILLAGGLGTRLAGLYPGLPKPMVPVAGQPFLSWVLRYWGSQGISRIVLATGHLAGVVEEYVRSRDAGGPGIRLVREPEPLGTGGAVRFCAEQTELSDPFLVANADSLVLADLSPVWWEFEQPELDGLIVGVEVEDAARFGTLHIGPDGRLAGFDEKRPGRGLINGGVYVLRRCLLDRFPPQKPLSIEKDVFPALLASGAKLGVFRTKAEFLDMGTPESLRQAEDFVARNFPEPARRPA